MTLLCPLLVVDVTLGHFPLYIIPRRLTSLRSARAYWVLSGALQSDFVTNPRRVSLHQPRYQIFRMFDHLLLLAPGGKTVRQLLFSFFLFFSLFSSSFFGGHFHAFGSSMPRTLCDLLHLATVLIGSRLVLAIRCYGQFTSKGLSLQGGRPANLLTRPSFSSSLFSLHGTLKGCAGSRFIPSSPLDITLRTLPNKQRSSRARPGTASATLRSWATGSLSR